MNKFSPPYLQPYKGRATRHTCPECGTKDCFTLYIDGNTNEPINSKVGKCNREIKCGYHYTPKQYYDNNQLYKSNSTTYNNIPKAQSFHSPSPLERAGVRSGEIPFSYVENSASYKSNFIHFLCGFLTEEQIHKIGEEYAIGATKNKEIIFWQIDIQGKVRTGKIMQYNPETGKRIKHESGAIDWVHNKLKHQKLLPDNFNLQQCFFGEHLLRIYPNHTVAIVESEKTAFIASAVFPKLIWLASGGIQGLTVEKCKVLANRNVILYPDLNAGQIWLEKTTKIQKECNCSIKISYLIENISSPEAKANGLDLADYIINQMRKVPKSVEVINRYSPLLNSLIKKNPALSCLVNTLDLIEM